jgi:hypothetical protein
MIKLNKTVTSWLLVETAFKKVSWFYCFYGAILELYQENLVALGGESCSSRQQHSTLSVNAWYYCLTGWERLYPSTVTDHVLGAMYSVRLPGMCKIDYTCVTTSPRKQRLQGRQSTPLNDVAQRLRKKDILIIKTCCPGAEEEGHISKRTCCPAAKSDECTNRDLSPSSWEEWSTDMDKKDWQQRRKYWHSQKALVAQQWGSIVLFKESGRSNWRQR